MDYSARKLGLSEKAATILHHIPYDKKNPISSKEIEPNVPYNSREIAATISQDLHLKYVARIKGKNGWAYFRIR